MAQLSTSTRGATVVWQANRGSGLALQMVASSLRVADTEAHGEMPPLLYIASSSVADSYLATPTMPPPAALPPSAAMHTPERRRSTSHGDDRTQADKAARAEALVHVVCIVANACAVMDDEEQLVQMCAVFVDALEEGGAGADPAGGQLFEHACRGLANALSSTSNDEGIVEVVRGVLPALVAPLQLPVWDHAASSCALKVLRILARTHAPEVAEVLRDARVSEQKFQQQRRQQRDGGGGDRFAVVAELLQQVLACSGGRTAAPGEGSVDEDAGVLGAELAGSRRPAGEQLTSLLEGKRVAFGQCRTFLCFFLPFSLALSHTHSISLSLARARALSLPRCHWMCLSWLRWRGFRVRSALSLSSWRTYAGDRAGSEGATLIERLEGQCHTYVQQINALNSLQQSSSAAGGVDAALLESRRRAMESKIAALQEDILGQFKTAPVQFG